MTTRLESLQAELEKVQQMKCLPFDLKAAVIEAYRHEIRAEKLRLGVDVDD